MIRFTPFVDEKGVHAIRFEGQLGLEAVFAGVVAQAASPISASWNQLGGWLKRIDGLRHAA